jgi:hypothetical protein
MAWLENTSAVRREIFNNIVNIRALTFGEISPKRGNWRIFGEQSGESLFGGKFLGNFFKLDGTDVSIVLAWFRARLVDFVLN